jgi:hypothetical protein
MRPHLLIRGQNEIATSSYGGQNHTCKPVQASQRRARFKVRGSTTSATIKYILIGVAEKPAGAGGRIANSVWGRGCMKK